MSARDGGVFAELQRQRRDEHGEARGELARGPGGGGGAERDVGGAERGKELSEGRAEEEAHEKAGEDCGGGRPG